MKQLRLAYLSANNPRDKKVWSGTHYWIYKSLSGVAEVDILGPYEPKWRVALYKLLNQIYLTFFKKRISYRHSLFISKGYAGFFERKLRLKKYDYIIAPAASCEIASLNTDIPIIYMTDGTFAGCLNYHESLSQLTQKSIQEGNQVEELAITKSKLVIVSSAWAANSVIKDYGKHPTSVITIPYGANLEYLPTAGELNFISPTQWKLLFVGVYWQNKGGDIALTAFKQLKDKGYNVFLTVVGCEPPKEVREDGLSIIPFIDKNSNKGQKQLSEIFKEHHILLLPTRFDCTPIVINEASAFGMPCLVANSGGVAGHLHEGQNGFLMDYNDKGSTYAAKIEELILNPDFYTELRKSTLQLYHEKLNWESWLKEVLKRL